MELQFVFGNPSKGKKKKRKGASMAKRKKLRKKRNPIKYIAKHDGKTHVSKPLLTSKEAATLKARVTKETKKLLKLPLTERSKARTAIVAIKKKIAANQANKADVRDFLKKFNELGVHSKTIEMGLKAKGGKVAKKKKRKKAKKSSHKKASKKRRVKASSKKRRSKKKHVKRHVSKKAKKSVKRSKKARKVSRKRRSKAKKHPNRKVVLKHKFGSRKDKIHASIPKLKKGKKAHKSYKRKKRRYSFMVKRTNPIFGSARTAMNKVDKEFQTATGHDLVEAGLLFGAGAALPVIENLLMKVPGASQLKAKVGEFGPEASAMSSSVVTILGLGALHYAIQKVPALKKAEKAEPALRALIAASVVKAGSALSGVVARATGMSGVLYTPLSGVNFTPMSGVNFTPMSGSAPQMGIYPKQVAMQGQPQMGIYPQLNGSPQMGYGADFGRGFDVSDYGGGSGYTEDRKLSPSDFGGCEDDADYGDEEPVLDQSSGSL